MLKEEFRTVWSSWLSLFIVMVSGIDDIKTYSKSHNALFAVVLLVIFVFIMTVLLLNILIALMSDAAAKVNENEKSQFQLSRAAIIDELETTLPQFLKKRSAKLWYPRYIHFIKVNHDYESVKMLDLGMSAEDAKADPGSDASSEGSSSSDEDGKGGGLADDVAQLKTELAEARQQIGRMLEIQEALARQALSSKAFKALFEQ
jgi:cell division protein FtsI/penicillin-binding protein 2